MFIDTVETSEENIPKITERTYAKILTKGWTMGIFFLSLCLATICQIMCSDFFLTSLLNDQDSLNRL